MSAEHTSVSITPIEEKYDCDAETTSYASNDDDPTDQYDSERRETMPTAIDDANNATLVNLNSRLGPNYCKLLCQFDSEESAKRLIPENLESSHQEPHETQELLPAGNENAFLHLRDAKTPLPTPQISLSIKIRAWFTPYRQLFVSIFALNLVGVVFELSNHWSWASSHLTLLVTLNMLVAIAIRSEWILRFLYWIAVKLFRPKFFPLWFRVKTVGILYHIGGVHSSSGLSALLWLTVASFHHYLNSHLYNVGLFITLSICWVCLFVTCITAFPIFRGTFHNAFEYLHRFLGWLGILSTISYIVLECLWDVSEHRWDTTASRVASKPQLWFLVAICVIVIFSWITTAKVPVTIFAASDKASVIRVPGGLTSGLHTRISAGGLREWHIFGSISEGKNAEYHYIVAAVQGDFTRMLNTKQPTMLYTKRWKPCGLPYFSRLFKKGLAICTGSGIGAVASTCIQHDNWFLIWIGPNLEKTYGKEIMQLICDRIPSERRLIWDTRGSLGRPDVVQLLQVMHEWWKAEVTLFIGSPALNESVLRSSRALKIPVFGSIWDA